MDRSDRITVDLSAVVVAVTDEVPRILTTFAGEDASPGGEWADVALPRGPLDIEADRTLERGLRRWVSDRTGLDLGYVEQLYTFGDQLRDPRERAGGPRVVSIAYLALVREDDLTGDRVRWCDWYALLPWEDHRDGRPAALDGGILPRLEDWVAATGSPSRRARRERVDICFGVGELGWDPERTLERYELLYEAGLVEEAGRDGHGAVTGLGEAGGTGQPMALDHRRIAATALARIRGKVRYRPVVFELLPSEFTLLELQRVVEALTGLRLHKQNLRRLVDRAGLVEGTGRVRPQPRGRPAELFRFRREVVRERPAPGVGLPRR
jgi:hypothetical protein